METNKRTLLERTDILLTRCKKEHLDDMLVAVNILTHAINSGRVNPNEIEDIILFLEERCKFYEINDTN